MKTVDTKVRSKIHQSTQLLKFKNRCYRHNVPYYNVVPKRYEKPDERKNQSALSQNEKDAFIAAYNAINISGVLGTMVSYHADMNHMMHSNMGEPGVQRFCPWHRVYLAELEELLQAINPTVTIPYWDWTVDQEIPTWLEGFTPTVIGTSTPEISFPIVITRTPGLDIPNLPPKADVDTLMAKSEFREFTLGLEDGRFAAMPEFQTGMHDQVHVWVGGAMGVIPTAPADPMFWTHHANCDRLWSVWQNENPNKNPSLAPPMDTMDPWSVKELETRDTLNFGYIYV
jgi:tyrosinase